MRKLKFSICIPTYKGVDLIDDALKSIFSQKFQDYEIIVCNDSPEDHQTMKEKLDSYSDSRIRFFANKKNLGCPLNIRRITKEARNEILFLLAQDDILLGEALQKTHDAFFLDRDIGAVTRPYYQFYDNVNKPVRAITPYNVNKDSVISVFDGEKEVQKIFESLGQISGLAYRKEWIEIDFHEEIFPTHIYPFASITRKHKIVFLKDYTVAVRIPSSQCRFKSSIYEISPVRSWVKMLDTVYAGPKSEIVRKQAIKFITTTNFVGLIQIKNYSTFKNLLREIFFLIRYYPKNLFNTKFWFFSLGCLFMPRFMLKFLVDGYKEKINSIRLKKLCKR